MQGQSSQEMNKFEEYRLFVEDTARFSDRRQTVSNIYVAVNSIILAAASLLAKDITLARFSAVLAILLILTAGIVICLQWDRLILRYRRLISFRIDQLRAMEDHADMAGCHRMYHAEDALYPRDKQERVLKGQGLNFSDRESWLPRVFGLVYLLFLLAIGVATFLRFWR